jgi:hypothetical protein
VPPLAAKARQDFNLVDSESDRLGIIGTPFHRINVLLVFNTAKETSKENYPGTELW